MLSTTACVQGRSIMENLKGQTRLRLAATKAFAESVRCAQCYVAAVSCIWGARCVRENDCSAVKRRARGSAGTATAAARPSVIL